LLRLQEAKGVRWHIYLSNGAKHDIFDVIAQIEVFEFHPNNAAQLMSASIRTFSRIAAGTGVLINTESSQFRSVVEMRYRVTARTLGQGSLSRDFTWEDIVEATFDSQNPGEVFR
jgi:hypothetical protein